MDPVNRKPGRPPAGVDGSEVRTYPTIRLEPEALVLVQRVARARGLAVHAAASALVRAGAGARGRGLGCIEDEEDIEDEDQKTERPERQPVPSAGV